MSALSEFMKYNTPQDTIYKISSILDFMSESLSNSAAVKGGGMSSEGIEGLATLCIFLNLMCRDLVQ